MILKKDIDYNKEYFSLISDSAKDFLMKALDRKVETRWSAKKLLNHPWIVETSKRQEKSLDSERRLEIMQNIK